MDSYKIEWKPSAQKELRKLPKDVIPKLLHTIEKLAKQPYPAGVKKLVGAEQTYRLRVGVYRIVYNVFASKLVIEIIRIRHRKDVYRR